jgi:hypothetical protein
MLRARSRIGATPFPSIRDVFRTGAQRVRPPRSVQQPHDSKQRKGMSRE